MLNERTMVIVGAKMSFAQAEEIDLSFWADKTYSERLAETERLRRMIWTYKLGTYPNKMKKVGVVIKRSLL